MKSICAAGALMLCAGISLGCQTMLSTARSLGAPAASQAVTEEEVHVEVLAAANRFSAAVSTAADAIAIGTRDREVRRNTLLWKIDVIPLAQRAASQPKATEGLLALFTLATAQRRYLVEGEGRTLFGKQQEVAQDAAQGLESDIEATIARILPATQAGRLNAQVEQLASDNPIRGVFMLGAIQTGYTKAETAGAFDWFLAAPLAPFRALQGVESGAAAIHEFNTTARQLGGIAAALPQQTRWQLELFLYDLEDRETVVAGLAAFQKVADASAELSATAAGLPQATRRELEALLADSSQSQAELRQTLDQLRLTIASADGAVANARPLAESLERFAAQADQAGKSWGDLIATVRSPDGEPPAGAPRSRPFDITDYERTALRLQESAAELRALVAEVQSGGGTSLLDALLWRALAFVVACFALLLLYRALAPRIAGKRGAVSN
ncbi:MAG TPA: hypothetical protein VKF60_11540 [Myxococcota bacterium]|nr:hypothetical protein [Myxococcota bacterium]